MDTEIEMKWKRNGRAGRGVISVKAAGKPLYTEKLDITDRDARNRLIQSICERGNGIDRVALVEQLEAFASESVDDGDDAQADKISQAHALAALADGAELFHDGDHAYATVVVGGDHSGIAKHRETHPIKGAGFRDWLRRRYWKAYGKPPGGQALQDAIDSLSAAARFDGKPLPVAVRVALHDDALYLDLCNAAWEAVRVTKDGWRVVADPPARFIRKRGMLPLPTPVRGGQLNELRSLINAADDDDWRLMLAWLVGSLRSTGPYAVLAVNGEQGSAKSTTCRMLRRLIDPNQADLRAAPRDDRDLMIAAGNSWVIGLDNLSTISPALSDALCRLATGGGFATRELFTDDGERLFYAARPILFNGIEELATRPDLLERAIVLHLPSIPDDRRRTEAELWAHYQAARPRILGALLDAVAAALRNFDSVKLPNPPRMADFAQWVVAAESALPWQPGDFIRAYTGNRSAANALALESSAIAPALQTFIEERYVWDGTAKELLSALEADPYTDCKARNRIDWPRTPKSLSNQLRRIAPTLRRIGIEVEMGAREGRERRRIIRLRHSGAESSAPSAPSASGDPMPETAVSAAGGGLSADDPALWPGGERPPDPPFWKH